MAKPKIIDVIDQLPRNPADQNYTLRPDLSGVNIIAAHYRGTRVEPGEEPMAVLRADATYHMSRRWPEPSGPHGFGLMYHYGIAQNGTIYQTQPERLVTWNAMNANRRDIAIECQIGRGQTVPAPMAASLYALLDWLTTERPDLHAVRSNVWGHGEMGGVYGGGPDLGNSTDCPGPILPLVRAYRAGTVGSGGTGGTGTGTGGQLILPPSPAPAPAQAPRYEAVPPTPYLIGGAIGEYWRANGGVAELGYPVSEEQQEWIDGRPYTVQYFERARLEWLPGRSVDQVTRGRVGAELYKLKNRVA